MNLRPRKFSQLLIALVLLLALNPLLDELGLVRAGVLMNIFFTIVWLASLYAVSERKGRFYYVLMLAMSAVFLRWLDQIHHTMATELLSQFFLGSFVLSMAIFIFQKVLKDEKVTWDKISAALCVYLLVGFFWASVYTVMDRLRPMSFNNNPLGYRDFLYYSLITLATVGYGDITPVSVLARSLSALEAITGQFYLAVMIARLVGLQIVHAGTSQADR